MTSTRTFFLFVFVFAIIVVLIALVPICLNAQDSATGAIRGTVVHPAGADGAGLDRRRQHRQAHDTRPPATEGQFAFELLPPGDYSARVEAPACRPRSAPNCMSSRCRGRTGIPAEKVTVSAAPAMVETKPSAVSTLLDERAVGDLPLNGRRFSDLALFSPGVTQDPRGLTSATNGDLSFGGIRGSHNSFRVDGGGYNNAFFAQARGRYRAPYPFSTEVVQEFRMSTNAYGAEQGRSGGAVGQCGDQVGVEPHACYGVLLSPRSSFGASIPFLAFRPHNRQQQVGGTIGGPLKRNKIFFFAGFDQHIFHVPNVVEF